MGINTYRYRNVPFKEREEVEAYLIWTQWLTDTRVLPNTIIGTTSQCLLLTEYPHCKHTPDWKSSYVVRINPFTKPWSIIPIYWWRNRNWKGLNNISKATQSMNSNTLTSFITVYAFNSYSIIPSPRTFQPAPPRNNICSITCPLYGAPE